MFLQQMKTTVDVGKVVVSNDDVTNEERDRFFEKRAIEIDTIGSSDHDMTALFEADENVCSVNGIFLSGCNRSTDAPWGQ